jgi:hypothetical protein
MCESLGVRAITKSGRRSLDLDNASDELLEATLADANGNSAKVSVPPSLRICASEKHL